MRKTDILPAIVGYCAGMLLVLVLLISGCYNAATWCTKERPCTGDPVTRDTTVKDTTRTP